MEFTPPVKANIATYFISVALSFVFVTQPADPPLSKATKVATLQL